MADAADRVIALSGVSKRYGRKEAVANVDLEVGGGECLALLGHNGAGKTTLIKLMLGLTRPSAGEISICGRRPADRAFAALRSRIGFLPENVAFHETMTGREILAFYARLKGRSAATADELLERIGLGEAMHRRVRTYSKGMRQRLGLAQALLGDPALLFLDEPTTGLDPALRRQFYEIIREKRDRGATIFLSSHALNEVEARTDRIAIMKEGRLVACGTLEELRRATGYPTRIRVKVVPGRAPDVADRVDGSAEIRRVNEATVELACQNGEKLDLLRRVAGLDGLVRDVEVIPPGLEEIYGHFTDGAGPR